MEQGEREEFGWRWKEVLIGGPHLLAHGERGSHGGPVGCAEMGRGLRREEEGVWDGAGRPEKKTQKRGRKVLIFLFFF
jgi:hypothetical protein